MTGGQHEKIQNEAEVSVQLLSMIASMKEGEEVVL